MANNHSNLTSLFTDIADAIRSKTGGSDPIIADQFPEAIEGIESGGGADGESDFDAWVSGSKTKFTTNATTMRERCFYHNRLVSELDCPNLETIPKEAFYYDSALEKASFPVAVSAADDAFYYCSGLKVADETTVKIPLVSSVGTSFLARCSALTEINYTNKMTAGISLGNMCSNLERVNLPNVTIPAPRGIFGQCPKLTTVRLGVVDTLLQDNAFQSCSELVCIDVAQCQQIGNSYYSPFGAKFKVLVVRSQGVAALTYTYVLNNTPFANGGTGGVVLVPSTYVSQYENATNWTLFKGYGTCTFLPLEDYTTDGTLTGEIDWDKLNEVIPA